MSEEARAEERVRFDMRECVQTGLKCVCGDCVCKCVSVCVCYRCVHSWHGGRSESSERPHPYLFSMIKLFSSSSTRAVIDHPSSMIICTIKSSSSAPSSSSSSPQLRGTPSQRPPTREEGMRKWHCAKHVTPYALCPTREAVFE